MTIFCHHLKTGMHFMIKCNCGWETGSHATLEGAGRAADLHMAERFSLPSSRRPCDWPTIAKLLTAALFKSCGPPKDKLQ